MTTNWLSEIVESHKELESPASFWRWSALAAMSAILQDRVWFDKQIYKLYPNIYVMLHADSGLKKGPPISMANKFVAAVGNTKIIAGRSSIQGILKDMGSPAKTTPGGKIIQSGNNIFICSSELTSSIVDDPVATTILTDLFDRHYRHGEWRSLLKMESFSLKNPTVTMLTGTNEAHSEEFFAKKDVQGGYFARTFIIHEKESQTTNSLMFPLKNPPNDERASEYLKVLAKLEGPFEMDLPTRTYFDEWYKDFKETIKAQGVKDKTGTLNRFDDSVLKVAMLISLGINPELSINRKAVELAIKECEKLIGNVRRTTMSQGKSNFASQKALLLQELIDRDNHIISRAQLIKKYYLHASAEEWDAIAHTLKEGRHIVIEMQGNQVIFRMTETAYQEWKKHLEGKN